MPDSNERPGDTEPTEPVTEVIPVIPAQAAPATRPGWYPDAEGTVRWWDGQQWTEQVAPPRTSA
jgi:hypothetical protein